MSKALVVLDLQKGMLDQGEFEDRVNIILELVEDFEHNNEEVIFVKHIDYQVKNSPLFQTKRENLEIQLDTSTHKVFEKSKPSAFSNPEFKNYLNEKGIEHLFITGFNTEYCCLFTAINGEHEKFKVTLIEDATGSVNDEDTYEMKGLDIYDFVGSVLNWSNCVEVLYYDEFKDTYR